MKRVSIEGTLAILFVCVSTMVVPASVFARKDHPMDPRIIQAGAHTEEGVPVVVLIRGSDWDKDGTTFAKDVWSNAEFKRAAGTFTPVEIVVQDIDDNKGMETEESSEEENEGTSLPGSRPPVKLMKFPYLIACDKDGYPLCVWAGVEKTATVAAAVKFVEKGRRILRERDALWKQPATGVRRAENLGKGFDLIDFDMLFDDYVRRWYGPRFDEIRNMDPQDHSGYVLKYLSLDSVVEGVLRSRAKKDKAGLEEMLAQLDKRLKVPVLTTGQKQKIYAARYVLCRELLQKKALSQQEYKTRAIAELEALIKLDPTAMIAKAAGTFLEEEKGVTSEGKGR